MWRDIVLGSGITLFSVVVGAALRGFPKNIKRNKS